MRAVAGAFDETALGGKIDTRAIIVAWHGRILAERYAPGFDRGTRMLGWSMGKSVTSALIGTLVADGKLSLDAPPPIPALRQATDGRQAITLKQLLQMKSGLAFKETYGPGDDSTTMLFGRDDMAGYAAAMPLAHPPGTVWAYSSGTANILAHLVFDEAGGDLVHNYDYARQHLFEPAGMTSAEFAPDGTGSFVGSSYPYMTARDWARFGQLYLDGGEINGQRVLPADWVAFSHESAGRTNEPGSYGGPILAEHRWRQPRRRSAGRTSPADTYMALGHNDEIVAIVPSRQLVFVRLGWSTGGAGFDTGHPSFPHSCEPQRCPIGCRSRHRSRCRRPSATWSMPSWPVPAARSTARSAPGCTAGTGRPAAACRRIRPLRQRPAAPAERVRHPDHGPALDCAIRMVCASPAGARRRPRAGDRDGDRRGSRAGGAAAGRARGL